MNLTDDTNNREPCDHSAPWGVLHGDLSAEDEDIYFERKIRDIFFGELHEPPAGMNKDEKALVRRARRQFQHTWEQAEKLFDEITDKQLKIQILRLIESIAHEACLIGSVSYYSKFFPVAGLRHQKEQGKAGGRKSAQVRAKRADTTWRPRALELAKASRLGNPRGSLDTVASFIADGLKTAGVIGPKHSRLKQVVAQWIEKGDLPGKS